MNLFQGVWHQEGSLVHDEHSKVLRVARFGCEVCLEGVYFFLIAFFCSFSFVKLSFSRLHRVGLPNGADATPVHAVASIRP